MGQALDQNEELREDKNFEDHNHKKNIESETDADGHRIPKKKGDKDRQISIENDGGAHGRNNAGDKSGR